MRIQILQILRDANSDSLQESALKLRIRIFYDKTGGFRIAIPGTILLDWRNRANENIEV